MTNIFSAAKCPRRDALIKTDEGHRCGQGASARVLLTKASRARSLSGSLIPVRTINPQGMVWTAANPCAHRDPGPYWVRCCGCGRKPDGQTRPSGLHRWVALAEQDAGRTALSGGNTLRVLGGRRAPRGTWLSLVRGCSSPCGLWLAPGCRDTQTGGCYLSETRGCHSEAPGETEWGDGSRQSVLCRGPSKGERVCMSVSPTPETSSCASAEALWHPGGLSDWWPREESHVFAWDLPRRCPGPPETLSHLDPRTP